MARHVFLAAYRARGLDRQLATEAVDDHVPGGAVVGQLATRLAREEEQAQRTTMDQAGLPVPHRRVRLREQGPCELGEVQGYHGTRETGAGVRPEPLVCLSHRQPYLSITVSWT